MIITDKMLKNTDVSVVLIVLVLINLWSLNNLNEAETSIKRCNNLITQIQNARL